MTFDIPIEPIPPAPTPPVSREADEVAPRWTVVAEVNPEGKERFYVALLPVASRTVRLWLDGSARPVPMWGRKQYRSRERAERVRQRFVHRYSKNDWQEE